MLFKIIPNLQCLKFIAGMQFVYNLKEKSLKYVFGLFKIAVIAQQIYFRYKKGFTKDRRFGLLNLAVMSLSIMAKQAIIKNRLSNLFE